MKTKMAFSHMNKTLNSIKRLENDFKTVKVQSDQEWRSVMKSRNSKKLLNNCSRKRLQLSQKTKLFYDRINIFKHFLPSSKMYSYQKPLPLGPLIINLNHQIRKLTRAKIVPPNRIFSNHLKWRVEALSKDKRLKTSDAW